MADIYNGLRLTIAIENCGRRVMYKIFLLGTPDKSNTTNLIDYLENLPPTSSANYLKVTEQNKKFDTTQNGLIAKSPDGSEFDVSLLFLCIKLACENVAQFNDPKWWTPSTEMEYYVTALKNMRNYSVHGKLAITDNELLEKTMVLGELLTGCLKTSGERYALDKAKVNEEIRQVKHDLDQIQQKILGEEDLIRYCSKEIHKLMIEDSTETLKKIFHNIVCINPMSFITDNLRLEADKVFVDIEVKQGKHRGEGEHIDYRDLLKFVEIPLAHPDTSAASHQQSPLAHSATSDAPDQHNPLAHSATSASSHQQISSARPKILLLEGLAGSGKTTLVSMVTRDWIKEGQGKIKGLDNYDLMLWVQCRDSTLLSYQDLLDRLMPDVSLKFRSLLPRVLKLCKLLIIVDGLDEINESSRKLMNSLLHEFKNSSNTAFMCTSRPEKLEMFKTTIPPEYDITFAELRGILEHLILEFVHLSHVEIEKQTNSKRSTERLVREVEKLKGFQEYLSLPMNLILLVYIWDQAPDGLNIATVTQTELYNKIHHLCQKKLFARLANHPRTNLIPQQILQNKIQLILMDIYLTALESLSHDQLILEDEKVNQLITACEKQGLPHEELLSAFLSLKPTWTWEGIREQYSAPHKGIQDYYSAMHIVMALKCQLLSPTFPLMSFLKLYVPAASPGFIWKVLKQIIKTAEMDMTKYQNVLVHVAGLLHLTLDCMPEALAREVVDLLHESGMRHEDHWLDLLKNTKVAPVTAKYVAPFINTDKDIEISDNSVRSYEALLPHLKPCRVRIVAKSDPADLPRLPDLLAGLAHHHCIELSLEHHYFHDDDATTSDHILQRIQSRSDLEVFWGHLSSEGLEALPPSLKWLRLAVVSDAHARCLLPHLHAAVLFQTASP
ncbi:uncharacterized protein [Procambarus clarkii]|uniref:uncharacterized protein n=1 Tax=Procambarus clarkii TaxID=6728 RepID=UPI003743E6F9